MSPNDDFYKLKYYDLTSGISPEYGAQENYDGGEDFT
jgi:hypothetical protein